MDKLMESEINTLPSQYQIFKGKSAMRIQLSKPVRLDQKFQVGCLFMQLAPSKPGSGQTGYKWETDKISAKIGVNDITSIVHGLRNHEEVNLFHKFNGNSKTIKFDKNQSKRGSYFVSINESKEDGTKNSIAISLSPSEATAFTLMLESSLPLIHNWV